MLRYLRLLIVGFIFLQGIQSLKADEPQLRIGSLPNLGILPLIAKHEGLFAANNLKVDYRKFQTGKITMDALISGDVEVGTIVDSNIAYIN